MKIFAAIADAETVKMFHDKKQIKLNYLISYYYLDGQADKVTKKYRHMIDSLYLDSGAYSAERQSINISVTEYSTYLKLYGRFFDQYFNLDNKFDDPEHNYENQIILEERLPDEPKKPIPVIHDNADPFTEFRSYVHLGHDYIALGSTTPVSDDVYEKIKHKYPDVKIHFFGSLDWEELAKRRPDSADAANWAHAAGNGNIMYWDTDEKKVHRVQIGNRDRRDNVPHFKQYEHREKLEDFLDRTFSWEYSDLLRKGGPEKRMVVNLYFYNQMEIYLNSLS